MPEADGRETKQFHPDGPRLSQAFFLKGSCGYDSDMPHRLAQILQPDI
jgi:hypothetical protein